MTSSNTPELVRSRKKSFTSREEHMQGSRCRPSQDHKKIKFQKRVYLDRVFDFFFIRNTFYKKLKRPVIL